MTKYETQQKVIEAALESLENGSKQMTGLSEEEEFWMRIRKFKSVCTIQRETLKVFLETLNIDRYREYVTCQKPLEFIMEVYYQMPLRECSLQDILNALVILHKVSNLTDTVEYTDDGDHYTLKMTHDFGANHSKMLQVVNESLFSSLCVYVEYIVSERSLFIKLYKNANNSVC